MHSKNKSPAVIYARVSDHKQVTQGHGLDSQITRCKEYASHRQYEVESVFTDDITGASAKRPGFEALIRHLSMSQNGNYFVIIDDISRFARDVKTHLELRELIRKAGGILQSPKLEFGDDPDSKFRENILASSAQHFREKNAETTRNRMRARVQSGYWVFKPPIGYMHASVSGHGKLLVRDEPIATIIAHILESFSNGHFETPAEVKRFLEGQPEFMKRVPKTGLTFQRVTDILRKRVYCGYVEKTDWGIPLTKGHHEPLISLETFERIQKRLNGPKKAPVRKDLKKDFPLRGFLQCSGCGYPLTANWSKGKSKSYPYYLCQRSTCPLKGKSYSRDDVESEFQQLLTSLQPKTGLFVAAKHMFSSLWEQRKEQTRKLQSSVTTDLRKTETDMEKTVQRIVECSDDNLVGVYEKHLVDLREKAVRLENKRENLTSRTGTFEDNFELAMGFLSKPYEIWENGNYTWKRIVLRLAFSQRITYCPESGLRTPKASFLFKALEEFASNEEGMVPPHGIIILFLVAPCCVCNV